MRPVELSLICGKTPLITLLIESTLPTARPHDHGVDFDFARHRRGRPWLRRRGERAIRTRAERRPTGGCGHAPVRLTDGLFARVQIARSPRPRGGRRARAGAARIESRYGGARRRGPPPGWGRAAAVLRRAIGPRSSARALGLLPPGRSWISVHLNLGEKRRAVGGRPGVDQGRPTPRRGVNLGGGTGFLIRATRSERGGALREGAAVLLSASRTGSPLGFESRAPTWARS